MNLDSPVSTIPRVSAAYAKRLNRLGIQTVRDLVYYFPHRYDDFSKITKIADIKINETVTIHGEIINAKTIRTFKKKMFLTEALVKDETGTIRAVWYNQPFLMRVLKKGNWLSLAGNAIYDGKTMYFSNPAHEKIGSTKYEKGSKKDGTGNNQETATSDFRLPARGEARQRRPTSDLTHTGRLVPIYSETARLTSKWLRYILKSILPKTIPLFKDWLPPEIKKSQNLINLNNALEKIHFPETQKDIDAARRRLGFDELFLIQLFVLEQKKKWQTQRALKIKFDQPLIKNFVDSLPFKLTDAQRKSAWEILQDLEKSKPMNRLLEGDVGSGKTVVATMAALQTVKADYQVAFMAPTEILAQQHFQEITKLLNGFGVKIGLITGSETRMNHEGTSSSQARVQITNHDNDSKKKNRNKTRSLKTTASFIIHNSDIIIGTHSLIQEKVQFKNLALVIIDEQHRFGVSQRAALQKPVVSIVEPNIARIEDGLPATIPHLLSMTATPIPRTLALTIYGDLDLSLLNEMPKGRQKIITKIVAPNNRKKAYEFIRQQIKTGRQVFVICPRIEKGNKRLEISNWKNLPTNSYQSPFSKRSWDDVKAVIEEYEKLSKKIFPDLKIAMLHGKLKPKEKEKIMSEFKQGKTDILVSTSVVEVGIDISNATVMMIEGAERFGLAQLYQFKGRVGRGAHQSYCFLFTESSSQTTSQRLKAITTAQSGFELAEKDLAIRGPGEFYGTRQWGLPDLTMASLTDIKLIKSCRVEAKKLLDKDSELKNYPLLKEKLSIFKTAVHLE